jgi:hypothetical protein
VSDDLFVSISVCEFSWPFAFAPQAEAQARRVLKDHQRMRRTLLAARHFGRQVGCAFAAVLMRPSSGADCHSSDAVNTSRPSHHPVGMNISPRHARAVTDNRPADLSAHTTHFPRLATYAAGNGQPTQLWVPGAPYGRRRVQKTIMDRSWRGVSQAHPLCRLGSGWLGVEEAGSAGRSHQRLQCTTSWKGRRSGLTSGRSGRSAG